jgi:FtsP/CotA-like multicopper oxidase with cupredoxin domain
MMALGRSVFVAFLAWATLGIGACHSTATDAPPVTPPSDDSPGLVAAVDTNPDPTVFEFTLEAKGAVVSYVPGLSTPSWTYNGTVPGPLVDVNVGDELRIHFKSSLTEPTTIHWHGLRVPNEMDGAPAVQAPVTPGGTFEYVFKLTDPGLYWFHPHYRSDSQIRHGLYGVIRVRGPSEPKIDHEHVLVLDDATLGADGALPADVDDYATLPMDQKLHGRWGSTILVNGKADRVLDLQAGAVHRFRFVNSANLRYFNLAVPGHVWRVIGTDGSLFEKPYDIDHLLIGPAERYDALLIPKGAPGAVLTLTSDAYQRADDDPQPAAKVAALRISNEPAIAGRVLPDVLPGVAVPRLVPPPGDPIEIELDQGTVGGTEGYTLPMMDGMSMPMTGDPIFTINKKAGSDIPPIDVALGGLRTFHIHNVSHQIHIFHLHGFFFQIVDTDDLYDAALNPLGLRKEMISQAEKDTITVRSGYSVTIVGAFDRPGKWMFHCHIPEHSERGMMAEVHVGVP